MIDAALVEKLAVQMEQQGLTEQAVHQLRERYPGISMTYCMDDDVGHTNPVLASASFNVYLVDTREHCLRLTTQYAHAAGLVFAAREADDS